MIERIKAYLGVQRRKRKFHMYDLKRNLKKKGTVEIIKI